MKQDEKLTDGEQRFETFGIHWSNIQNFATFFLDIYVVKEHESLQESAVVQVADLLDIEF